jgi:hypothetical protein
VHDDPSGRLKEQLRLTKLIDHALAVAKQEIKDLHKHYKEQEQVIKDHDDLIIELLDEDDNSNSDSDDEGNNDGNGDGNDDSDDNIEEVP